MIFRVEIDMQKGYPVRESQFVITGLDAQIAATVVIGLFAI